MHQQTKQSLQHEVLAKQSQAVHAATAHTTTAVRELEARTKAELLQLAANLKAVVQSCSNHQQQVNLQVRSVLVCLFVFVCSMHAYINKQSITLKQHQPPNNRPNKHTH